MSTITKTQLIFPEISKNQVVQIAFKIHKYSSAVEEVCLEAKLSVGLGWSWGGTQDKSKRKKTDEENFLYHSQIWKSYLEYDMVS